MMSGYADVVVLRHPEPGAVAVSISIGSPHFVFMFCEIIRLSRMTDHC